MRRPGFWVQVYQSLEIRIKHLRYLRGTTLSCWWPAYAPKRRSHVGVAHPPIPVSKPEPLRRNCASDVCPKVDLAPPSRAQNRPTPAGLRRHRCHKRHKRHSFQWNIASKTRDWSYSGIYIDIVMNLAASNYPWKFQELQTWMEMQRLPLNSGMFWVSEVENDKISLVVVEWLPSPHRPHLFRKSETGVQTQPWQCAGHQLFNLAQEDHTWQIILPHPVTQRGPVVRAEYVVHTHTWHTYILYIYI